MRITTAQKWEGNIEDIKYIIEYNLKTLKKYYGVNVGRYRSKLKREFDRVEVVRLYDDVIQRLDREAEKRFEISERETAIHG